MLTPAQLATLTEGERAEIATALDAHEATLRGPVVIYGPDVDLNDPAALARLVAAVVTPGVVLLPTLEPDEG